MSSQADVEFRLSGGTTNTAPALGLGGAMAQNAQRSQYATGGNGIAGVQFVDAAGNAEGAGTLALTVIGASKTLRWTPNGGDPGAVVNVSGGGRFSIPAGASRGYFLVDVTAAQLPAADATINPVISNLAQTILPDTDPETVDYYCVYVYAAAALANVCVKLQQPQAGGRVEMGADPLIVDGNAQPIPDATTAPVGVVFDTVDITIGAMVSGGNYPVWLKRTAGEVPATANGFLLVCFD